MTDLNTNVIDMAKEFGVSDLPSTLARGKFALALKYERMGNNAKATEKLQEAIDAETEDFIMSIEHSADFDLPDESD